MIPDTTSFGFVEKLYSQILLSCQVTTAEIGLLKWAQTSNAVSAEEQRLIQRIFYALRRGWILEVGVPNPKAPGRNPAEEFDYQSCA